MPELADVFRRHGPEYRKQYLGRILPSQLRAMRDIEHCRTETMGGHAYLCPDEDCGHVVYSYHSCKNRHCPKCQNNQAELWLEKQRNRLLPVPYFLVTVTLPQELRATARSNQKVVYNILFQSSAAALQKLALDPRFVGGRIGMIGVLHTCDRTLGYHPHIHYLVPGGGLSPDHSQWLPARNKFLVRVELLSMIFKAKFRDALKKTELFEAVPAEVWKKNWVVHSEPVGSGREALSYLARYLFRVAISNSRLLSLDDDKVAFEYEDSDTKERRVMSLAAMEFIRRFLQHVLPKGFMKVRYYGLLSPRNRNLLAVVMYLLAAHAVAEGPKTPAKTELRCPKCGNPLRLLGRVSHFARGPPL